MRGVSSTVFLVVALLSAGTAAGRQEIRVYDDPIGDALYGHGDIGRATVSDRHGIVTLAVQVVGLRKSDEVVLELAPQPAAASETVLVFGRSGSWVLWHIDDKGAVSTVHALPGTRLLRGGELYTFRFGSDVLRRAKRFFFEAHVKTATVGVVSDWAPNGDYDSAGGWWPYTLTTVEQ